ncbi:Translation Initiation factor eIF- 4e-like domain [Pseudocohnilembus persalinus]|uniref:Translation Initiation factor eIF-4e-like domain n=1 Tax=Pseudocohnilembus persalinus TaxID=266149 RepID=A0A0V0QDL8_PSEPJ|nr:Translation Initiation factor eIF- 4e-like domain [Pseudocohnilembus persalinus]|eukprot:KRX00224.1 Translation Initiation factor eIF- 4e-like domain [Pseudocohnilembus persalinus]
MSQQNDKVEDVDLNQEWICWEYYRSQVKSTSHDPDIYIKDNKQIFKFQKLSQFTYIWKNSAFGDPLKVFADQHQKIFKIDDREVEIETLSIFKNGIKPMFEDEANKEGCDYQFLINKDSQDEYKDKVRKIWEYLVMNLIVAENKFKDIICGIRIADKVFKSQIRLEIWIKEEKNMDFYDYLKKAFSDLLKIDVKDQIFQVSHKH